MKPIVFKFKDEAKDDDKGPQEWRSYAVRDYPKMPTWLHFAGYAILAIGIGIGCWVGHSGIGMLAGFVACFVLVIVAHPIRCPQCRGGVMTRGVEEENGYERFIHDCPVCRISWRCEKRRTD